MNRRKAIRLAVFAGTCLLILLVCSRKIIRAEITLRCGTPYLFKISGYDPYDLARGKYLAFTMPHAAKTSDQALKHNQTAYVSLEVNPDGLADFGHLGARPPPHGDWMTVTASGESFPAKAGRSRPFQQPFRRFYLNERLAKKAEDILREAERKDTARLRIRVHRGAAAIEDLLIGDTPILELCRKSRN